MIGKGIKVLVMIGILLMVSLAQRGGSGGSRSSSRSSRSYSSGRRRYGSGFSFWGSGNGTATNSTTDEDGLEGGDGLSWKWITGFLGAFGVLAYIGNNSQKKKEQ